MWSIKVVSTPHEKEQGLLTQNSSLANFVVNLTLNKRHVSDATIAVNSLENVVSAVSCALVNILFLFVGLVMKSIFKPVLLK